MKHWHRCARWFAEGLACPFQEREDHEDGEDDRDDPGPKDDDGISIPRVGLPARRGGRAHANEVAGVVAGAGAVPDWMVRRLRQQFLDDQESTEDRSNEPGRIRHDAVAAGVGEGMGMSELMMMLLQGNLRSGPQGSFLGNTALELTETALAQMMSPAPQSVVESASEAGLDVLADESFRRFNNLIGGGTAGTGGFGGDR